MSEFMHLLTGAYAVNGLDPDERAEFEEHLAGCPECATEVRGLLETTARLAESEAIEPPARLKLAVMAQIATTPQLPASSPSLPAETAAGDDTGVVVPLRRPGWNRGQRALAAAAAFLAVVAIGLSALLAQSNSERTDLSATQAAITAVLTAPDARTLAGSIAGGGRGTVVVSPSQGTSVFVGAGLPAAPAGHTYELWYMGAGGTAAPAGTFEPGANGQVTAVLSGTIGQASAVGMTVEPAGGSAKPTTTPIMAVRLV
jgi:anti-sigma-K factor RskA